MAETLAAVAAAPWSRTHGADRDRVDGASGMAAGGKKTSDDGEGERQGRSRTTISTRMMTSSM